MAEKSKNKKKSTSSNSSKNAKKTTSKKSTKIKDVEKEIFESQPVDDVLLEKPQEETMSTENDDDLKMDMTTSDTEINEENKDLEVVAEDSKDVSVEAPKESATKVFGQIAAFSWWKRLSYINIAWTFGILLIFLAVFWINGDKITDNDRNIANIIFAGIVSAVSFFSLIITWVMYKNRSIEPFLKGNEKLVLLFSFFPLGFIANFVFSSLEAKAFYAHEKVTSLGYKKPKFVMPHVFIILLSIILLIIIASWFLTWNQTPMDALKFDIMDEFNGNGNVVGTLFVNWTGEKWEASYELTNDFIQWLSGKNHNALEDTVNTINTAVSSINNRLQSIKENDLSSVLDKVFEAVSGNNGTNKWIVFNSLSNQIAPAGFLYTFIAPIKGFINAADLIIFLMIMGGFLAIVTESGALEAGLGRMVKKLQGKEIILVPILFFLFSIGGATYGMAEETLPFYLLLIPVFLAAGFDTYSVLLTILLGAGLGTAASILNPFVVNTAVSAVTGANSSISLTPSDGIIWRIVIYFALTIPGCIYATLYARKVKKNPLKSATYDLKEEHEKSFSFDLNSLPEFTNKRKAILAIFGLTFVSMIISVIAWEDLTNSTAFINATEWVDKYFPFLGGLNKEGGSLVGPWGTWYLTEMGFLFFLSALIVGSLSWKGSKHFIDKFMFGAGDFIGVGMVIAISRGISIVVTDTGLDNIIIDNLSKMMGGINNAFAITVVFFFVFFALSFLIPSTSGFASAVFPLVGPAIHTAGISGLTVSGSIASFSLASGIVNISMPSGGIFMSALSLSKIPLGKFYKNSWPFLVAFFVGSIALLLVGQAANIANSSIF